MNNHINILFQGCTVARSCMKRITSHNRHNTHISNQLWPQPGNLQPSCAVDFCAGSRRGKLDLASVVEMEEEESGGSPAKKTNICKFNNSWTEELHFLSRSHVNDAHAFWKCVALILLSVTVGKTTYLSLLNHSSTFMQPRHRRAAHTINTHC